MRNCSAYQREKKEEIILYIEGWALIKPLIEAQVLVCSSIFQTGITTEAWSNSPALPLHRKAVPRVTRSWTVSPLTCCRCPCVRVHDLSRVKSWMPFTIENSTRRRQNTQSGRAQGTHLPSSWLHTFCSPPLWCCQLIPSPALMVPCLESSCLLRWSLLPSLTSIWTKLNISYPLPAVQPLLCSYFVMN